MDKNNLKKLVSFFENKGKLRKYQKKELLFRPGDQLSEIGFIKSGFVRLFNVTRDGQEVTWQMFEPVLCLSVIQSKIKFNNRFFFEAMGEVEMWMAPRDEFAKFLKNEAELEEEINKKIMGEFMELMGNLENLILGNAYMKVARVIHNLVNRYGENKGKDRVIKFATPHRMIASMTGLTRETVTLQILKMEKNKVVDNKGKMIYVRNMSKLAEAAMI